MCCMRTAQFDSISEKLAPTGQWSQTTFATTITEQLGEHGTTILDNVACNESVEYETLIILNYPGSLAIFRYFLRYDPQETEGPTEGSVM